MSSKFTLIIAVIFVILFIKEYSRIFAGPIL